MFRLGAIVKVSNKSRLSIFVEFALQLLCDTFKNRCPAAIKTGEDDAEKVLNLMDSTVPLLADALRLKYDKVGLLSCIFRAFRDSIPYRGSVQFSDSRFDIESSYCTNQVPAGTNHRPHRNNCGPPFHPPLGICGLGPGRKQTGINRVDSAFVQGSY
jgi:hypothetical protein